jgi:hypothetical protein
MLRGLWIKFVGVSHTSWMLLFYFIVVVFVGCFLYFSVLVLIRACFFKLALDGE